MINICIYTGVFGGLDRIIVPKYNNIGIDFIAFSDGQTTFPAPWKVRNTSLDIYSSARLKSRYIKIMGPQILFPYNVSVWIDGNIRVMTDMRDLVEEFLQSGRSIALVKHPHRSSILEEQEACLEYRKVNDDEAKILFEQVSTYLHEGLPDNRLYESNVIFRRHDNIELNRAMEFWWQEVSTKSIRDQISLPYTLWKFGIEPHVWKWNTRQNSAPLELYSHLTGTFNDTVNYLAARKNDSMLFKAAYFAARAARKMGLR